jgi:hypothetical protein
VLRLGLRRLPITQVRRIRSPTSELDDCDGTTEPDGGLSIVLVGLRSQLLSPE